MTYSVQLASGGYLGWKFLERTAASQREALQNDSSVRRPRDYFIEKMPGVKGADDLVSDYKLLNVALQAFGLEADISNRQFIKRVLDADPTDSKSIVNRLSDKRYLALSEAFAKVKSTDSETSAAAVQDIANLFNTRSFERNIGEQYQEIELALNAQRELPALAGSSSSANTKWYQILSSKPLRMVFEGAFGFSSSFGQLPIDRQVSEMGKKLQRLTGSSDPSQFTESAQVDKLLKRYLLQSQVSAGQSASSYSIALQLLNGR